MNNVIEQVRQDAFNVELHKIAFSEDTKKGARTGANIGLVAGALPGAFTGLSLGAVMAAGRNIKDAGGRFGIMSHLTPKIKRKLIEVAKKNRWSNAGNIALLTGLSAAATGVPSSIVGGGVGAGVGSIKHHYFNKNASLEDVGPTTAQYGLTGAATGAAAGGTIEIIRRIKGERRIGNYSGLWKRLAKHHPKASTSQLRAMAERRIVAGKILGPASVAMLLSGSVGAGAGLLKRKKDNK
jgi:hypothetical protein